PPHAPRRVCALRGDGRSDRRPRALGGIDGRDDAGPADGRAPERDQGAPRALLSRTLAAFAARQADHRARLVPARAGEDERVAVTSADALEAAAATSDRAAEPGAADVRGAGRHS